MKDGSTIYAKYAILLKSTDGKTHVKGTRYDNQVTLFKTKRLISREERKIATSELLVTDKTFEGMTRMFSELRNREYAEENIRSHKEQA